MSSWLHIYDKITIDISWYTGCLLLLISILYFLRHTIWYSSNSKHHLVVAIGLFITSIVLLVISSFQENLAKKHPKAAELESLLSFAEIV